MDRDTALQRAIGAAMAMNTVFVLYQARDVWLYALYPTTDPDAIQTSIRYILPHGEVCKLS